MNMESPVRICIGAALVVILLLLSGTTVSGNALPLETTATTVKDERPTRHRINNTVWSARHKVKNADVALNELNPKESISEEHTEKNAKYKDRGRVKFHSQIKSTTESPIKRVRSTPMTLSTEASNVVVITPTPNVKNATQIIDSMKIYKKIKMPDAMTSSTTITPVSIKTEVKSEEEEEDYEDEEEEEEEDDKETFQKYTSTKFHDSTNFFTIPSYNDGDDFSHDFDKKDSKNKVVKQDYSTSFGSFSSFFPKESDDDESYKPDSFFDFASELTTPKNDFFDKKFQEISKSIMKNLASIKAKAPAQNASNAHKVVKEDVGVETLSNGTPSNKSTVIIKNTKEIRLLDNDEAGSANKELSDVHGTSIYYEMSVLSTETYAINHSNDEDCDKDTLPAEPTASTSSEEELASIKATQATVLPVSTKAIFLESKTEPYSRVPSSFIPVSSVPSNLLPASSLPTRFLPASSDVSVILNSISPDSVSKQSSIISSSTEKIPKLSPVIVNSVSPVSVSTPSSVMSSSTEKSSRIFSTSFSTRNRSYSKRLNFTGTKDSPNSVTSRTEQATSHQNIRPLIRKFHYTTPKAKPIWMAPRRNVTKAPLTRPTYPTTIYSEHFNIKDKFSTPRPKQVNNKTVLTTVSSDIDPVLQSDVSGIKKIVHSQSFSENSIPTLWKRGSTRYTTTTASSEETESGVSDLEIPPTLTAWALASLRSPPSIASPAVNATEPAKNLDENELQKVNDLTDKKETTTKSTTTITTSASNDFTSKKIVDIDQNKLPWRPLLASHQPIREATTETTTTEYKSERLPAESNVSVRSSVKPVSTTEKIKATELIESVTDQSVEETEQPWIPVTSTEDRTTERNKEIVNYIKNIAVESTKSTGFDSITKLPADVTTPNDDVITKSEENKTESQTLTTVPTTTDYEITTIRFTYVPTETMTETTEKQYVRTTPRTRWHPVFPTRTKPTTWENRPITTYRPRYRATTSVIEMTTSIPESTLPIETSSQIIKNETKDKPDSTEIPIKKTQMAIETMKIPPVTTREPIAITKIPVETSEVSATTTEKLAQTTVSSIESTKAPFVMTESATDSKESTTDTTEMSSETTEISSETTEISSETTEISSETTEYTQQTIEYTQQTSMNKTITEEEGATVTTKMIPIETTTPLDEIETTTIIVEIRTEINTERERPSTSTELVSSTEIIGTPSKESRNTASSSEENSDSNEVITQETTKVTPSTTATAPITRSTVKTSTETLTEITKVITNPETYITEINIITRENAKISDTTTAAGETTEDMIDTTTHFGDEMEDLTSYAGDMTTEASSRVLTGETGSGAGVAIAVSTIGVIALILLIGLLLVVRRRGRRGVYAQRCTPVSLDAYSLDSVSVGHRKGNHRLRASKRSYGNPAYDDEVTSHPMNYAALASFAMDVESIHAEFAEIPTVTVRPDEDPPGCEDKNRYSNVLPLPETRVPLSRIGNDPTTEYINASYITGPGNIRNYYIACQAPLPNTVVDFWRMIWEQNSRVIVMLTEYMENGVEKCYEYLPPSEISDNKRTFGDFQIILKKREQRDKYAISSVQLINLHTRTWREITHLWYFWPANGVPDDYDSVIDFLFEMRSYMKISQTAKEYDEEGVEVIYGDQSRSSFVSLAKLRSDDSSSGNGVNTYSPAKAEEQLRRNITNGTLGRLKDATDVEEPAQAQARPRPLAAVCASGAGRAAALLALDVCARALAARAADVPRVVRELRHQRAHALHNRHHYVFLYKVLSAYGHRLMGGSGVDAI